MAEGRGGVVKLSLTTDLVSYLKELDIRVIRFENRAVFESLELVLNSIRSELQETGKGTGIA